MDGLWCWEKHTQELHTGHSGTVGHTLSNQDAVGKMGPMKRHGKTFSHCSYIYTCHQNAICHHIHCVGIRLLDIIWCSCVSLLFIYRHQYDMGCETAWGLLFSLVWQGGKICHESKKRLNNLQLMRQQCKTPDSKRHKNQVKPQVMVVEKSVIFLKNSYKALITISWAFLGAKQKKNRVPLQL